MVFRIVTLSGLFFLLWALSLQPAGGSDDGRLWYLPDSLRQDSQSSGTLSAYMGLPWDHVRQDEEIAALLKAHREAAGRAPGIPGFRVHLYMDSGNLARLNTQRKRAEFENVHPGAKAYVVYEEPYFKLRVGDFRTRLDARRYLEEIRNDYPGAYIVVDTINFPEPD